MPNAQPKLDQYKALLLKWQKTINLVGPDTLPHIEQRHFDDSAQLVALLPPPREATQAEPSATVTTPAPQPESSTSTSTPATPTSPPELPESSTPSASSAHTTQSEQSDAPLNLFDIGSGAGFPGLVLAMLRPDLKVHLIESDHRKCTFLSTVSRETMTPAVIYNERIESLSTEIIPDIITARALAPLDKLLGYALPWAIKNPALILLLLKGEKAENEITTARQNFDFTLAECPSRTDKAARILRITELRLAHKN